MVNYNFDVKNEFVKEFGKNMKVVVDRDGKVGRIMSPRSMEGNYIDVKLENSWLPVKHYLFPDCFENLKFENKNVDFVVRKMVVGFRNCKNDLEVKEVLKEFKKDMYRIKKLEKKEVEPSGSSDPEDLAA